MPPKKAPPKSQAQAQAQAVIINLGEAVPKKKRTAKRRVTKRVAQPSEYQLMRRTIAYQPPTVPEYQRESMGAVYRDLLTTIQGITMARNERSANQIQLQVEPPRPSALETIQRSAETVGAVAETIGAVGEAVGKGAQGAQQAVGAYRDIIADTPFEGVQPPVAPRVDAPVVPRVNISPVEVPPAEAPEFSNRQLDIIIERNASRGAVSRLKRMRKAEKMKMISEMGWE